MGMDSRSQTQSEEMTEAERYHLQAEIHEKALKRSMSRFMAIGIFALVATVIIAATTIAWYANNRKVTAQNATITAAAGTPSLYIKAKDVSESPATVETDSSSIEATGSVSLFPISTSDCANWYYVSGWANTGLASAYTKVDTTGTTVDGVTKNKITESGNSLISGLYNNEFEGRSGLAAYSLAKFNVYTKGGVTGTNADTVDVYLNPSNPIQVEYTGEVPATDKQNLIKALRVGIYANGSLQFVYAPVAESGTGNSTGSSENTYYAVKDEDEIYTVTVATTKTKGENDPYLLYVPDATTASIGAVTATGTDPVYSTQTNSIKLCTASTENTDTGDIFVYVWLEGTDAQALTGLSDLDPGTLQVTLNLVGIQTPAASTT